MIDVYYSLVQMSALSKFFCFFDPFEIFKALFFHGSFCLMHFQWSKRSKKDVPFDPKIMITYLVEKFPPLVVIGLFHCHTHRRVPNTFTAGQIGIHMFSGARFDDLHPLSRRGSFAPTPRGWLWTHCCWFTFGSSNLHFRFSGLGTRQKSVASHVEKGANWQFFTFTGL